MRQLIEQVAATAGVPVPRMSALPGTAIRVLGVVSGSMKELAETSYMFERPFVLDSTASESRLGLSPTPFAIGLKETVAWWQELGD